MLFHIRRCFDCIFCGTRTYGGKRFAYSCGICTECDENMERTPPGGTFAGSPDVSYIISPLFYTGRTRDAIMRFKFEGWECCGNVFAYIMRQCAAQFPHLKDFGLVIPVPLSKARLNERGYNQSVPLAKAVADEIGIKYDGKTLLKIRNTNRQSRLSQMERIENVSGAYKCTRVLDGERIILVDDIYTTGATLNECARTLLDAGAKEIVGMTLSIRYKKEKNLFLRY